MLNLSGKRNFHDKNTLLTVSVEGFATAYTKVSSETDIYQVYEDRCFSIRMQGGGEN